MNVPTLRLQLKVDGKKKKFKTTKPSIFIGNASLCDIKVKLNDVGNFVEIKVLNNQIILVDKHTTSGLFLNNRRVHPGGEAPYNGEQIRIGDTQIDLVMELEKPLDASDGFQIDMISTKSIEHKPVLAKIHNDERLLDAPTKKTALKIITPHEESPTLNVAPEKTINDNKTAIREDNDKEIYHFNPIKPLTQIKNLTQENPNTQVSFKAQERSINDEEYNPSATQMLLRQMVEGETGQYKHKIEEYNEEIHELKTECLKVKKDIRLYEYSCEELKNKEKHLKEENNELKKILSEYEEKRNALDQEVSMLSSQREMAGVEVESFREEKRHLQVEIEEIKKELKFQKDRLEDFSKNMMDEYSAKKEEAIAYYETKVKEATDYFDNKEKNFKVERKEMQDELNSRLRECDIQIQKEKANWQEQLTRHQAELELIKEKIQNEAQTEKQKIIKAAEDEAIKTADEITVLAEKDCTEMLKRAEDRRDTIISRYEEEGNDLLAKLTKEAKEKKIEIISEGDQEKDKLISEGKNIKDEILQKAHHQAFEEKENLLEKAHLEKEEILKAAHNEKEKLLEDGYKEIEKLLEDAHLKKDKIIHDARTLVEKETHELRESTQKELNDLRQSVQDDLEEQKNTIQSEMNEIKKESKILDERMNHSRNEFRKEELSLRKELEAELKEIRDKFEQEMINKKLDQEKLFERNKERNLIKEKKRIESNISNVSDNILSLLEQKLNETTNDSSALLKHLPLNEIKEIVSDSFDVDSAVHNKQLGKFLLKNDDAINNVKRFYKKASIAGGVFLILIISFIINPNIISDTKELFLDSVSLNKSATDTMVESMKQARLSRPKFDPKRTMEVRDSYTESILYTTKYRELVQTIAYKKKWTVELSLFVYREMLESEELVIKYISQETALHNELIETYNTIYEEHKDKGIERLRTIEQEYVPKMKEIFKKDKNWKLFLEFRKKFFSQYRDNQ